MIKTYLDGLEEAKAIIQDDDGAITWSGTDKGVALRQEICRDILVILDAKIAESRHDEEEIANLNEDYCDTPWRAFRERHAQVGEPILRLSDTWKPANDTAHMSVPEMLLRIYRRPSHAVAPNNHTCPFLTVKEWSRIADYANGQLVPQAEPDTFAEGDLVVKFTGDYEQDGVFCGYVTTPDGAPRCIVAHPCKRGWMLHIYAPWNIRAAKE